MKSILVTLLLLQALTPGAATDEERGLANGSFEAPVGADGSIPGWSLGGSGLAVERLETGGVSDDGVCLRLYGDGTPVPSARRSLSQRIDAAPYRGKTIRFRVSARFASTSRRDESHVWALAVDADGAERVLGDVRIVDATWRAYEVEGPVGADALEVRVGVHLRAMGSTFLDDASVEVLSKLDQGGAEAPRALEKRGLVNSTAFARLLGYARHFHASDESALADWDTLAVHGMQRVEAAEDPVALAAALEEILLPVAPTLRVVPTTSSSSSTSPADPWAGLIAKDEKGRANLEVVWWSHVGFGQQSSRGVYHSERKREKLVPGRLARLFGEKRSAERPDPSDRLVIALPGDVTAYLPLAVYADSRGTIPHREHTAAVRCQHHSAGDRSVRLATVALAWNVFQHFYPYFDVVDVDWTDALAESLRAAAVDRDEREFRTTLACLVARLEDGHGRVRHAAIQKPATLPIRLAQIGKDLVVVAHVADAEPGESVGGIARGDILERAGGRPILEVLAEEAETVSAATEQYRSFATLRHFEMGSTGERVKLRVRSAATPEGTSGRRDVELEYRVRQVRPREPRPDPIAEIRDGIYYVDIERVTEEDVRTVLSDIASARGVIFDFRGYPRKLGIYALLPYLLDKRGASPRFEKPVITRPDRVGWTFDAGGRWQLPPRQPHIQAKRVFLTDGRAISYAESCMGIIEHYKLGAIVGEPTAGTNGNVNPLYLPGGYTINWTGMRVRKHDGSPHHGVGILPTHPIARTYEGIRDGRDEYLEAAIVVLEEEQARGERGE